MPTGANVFSSFRDGPLRAFGSSSLDLRGQCPFWPFSKGDNRTSGNPAMPPSPAFMCPGSRAEKARQSLPTPLRASARSWPQRTVGMGHVVSTGMFMVEG